MRVAKKKTSGVHEGDLTPMIDMTFQLIAFFMVLINFTQSEQNEKIQLPDSTLAKPPEGPLEHPIILHLTTEGSVIFAGQEIASLEGLRPYLRIEAGRLAFEKKPLSSATVVIRAHKDAATGKVQELIKV